MLDGNDGLEQFFLGRVHWRQCARGCLHPIISFPTFSGCVFVPGVVEADPAVRGVSWLLVAGAPLPFSEVKAAEQRMTAIGRSELGPLD